MVLGPNMVWWTQLYMFFSSSTCFIQQLTLCFHLRMDVMSVLEGGRGGDNCTDASWSCFFKEEKTNKLSVKVQPVQSESYFLLLVTSVLLNEDAGGGARTQTLSQHSFQIIN